MYQRQGHSGMITRSWRVEITANHTSADTDTAIVPMVVDLVLEHDDRPGLKRELLVGGRVVGVPVPVCVRARSCVRVTMRCLATTEQQTTTTTKKIQEQNSTSSPSRSPTDSQ